MQKLLTRRCFAKVPSTLIRMSFDPDTPIDVYVCFGAERGTKFPHWMLMLRSRESPFGTWVHSTGGPSQNRRYEVSIQGHKRFNSRGIQSTEYLGTIDPRQVRRVIDAARRVTPQQCQTYVVSLIAELERQTLLPIGIAERLYGRVRMSQRARDYAAQHPVPTPSFITPWSEGPSSSYLGGPRSWHGNDFAYQENGSGPLATGSHSMTLGPEGYTSATLRHYGSHLGEPSVFLAEPRSTTYSVQRAQDGTYANDTRLRSTTTGRSSRSERRVVQQHRSNGNCAIM